MSWFVDKWRTRTRWTRNKAAFPDYETVEFDPTTITVTDQPSEKRLFVAANSVKGADGADGANAYGSHSAFTQPAAWPSGPTVDIPATGIAWVIPGQIVFCENGGYYGVAEVGTSIVRAYWLGYDGGAVVGATVAAGKISPAGMRGPTGAQGAAGAAGAAGATGTVAQGYGSIYTDGASTTQVFATAGTYYKITQWAANNSTSSGVTPDYTTSKITVVSAGVYLVGAHVSCTSAEAGTVFTVAIHVNDVRKPEATSSEKVQATSSPTCIAITPVPLTLPAGGGVTLFGSAGTSSQTFGLVRGALSVTRIY